MSKSTIKTFKKTVWKSCATYIKLRDADCNGMVKCCTCDRWLSIYDSSCQAGHYVPGHNNTTYFDDAIIHCQCDGCNGYGKGEQGKYGIFLKRKYGYTDEILEELLSMKHMIKKVTMEELKERKKWFDDESYKLRKMKGLR